MTIDASQSARGKRHTQEIRVLVAEDSATVRQHLTEMMNETPGVKVVGVARDGQEALELVAQLRPDVVSMDINMPRMDGLEATRRIMQSFPTPVVVVSSLLDKDLDLSFQALQAGALAVVEKPPDRKNPVFAEKQALLMRTLFAMAAVRVIRRNTALLSEPLSTPRPLRPAQRRGERTPQIIAIGASAGGPSALSRLLRELPLDLRVPVAVVQHMPPEFIHGLARWLTKTATREVLLAHDQQVLEPGVVYLSPGHAHLMIARTQDALRAQLITEPGQYRYQPAVDVLFHSVAQTCGSAAIGIVLTGMGDDGAEGLLAMHQAGAYTFAQDSNSSTVFGMPNAAIERGAVQEVLSLAALPRAIINLL